MNTSTEEIATFVSGLDANSLPDRLVEVTSQHVLEVIAGVFAGSPTPEAVQINGILGHDEGSRTGAIAMLSHAAESDPIHAETTICAGLIAIPPALMFARDGETAIAAIIAG